MNNRERESSFIKDSSSIAPLILGLVFALFAVGVSFYLGHLLIIEPIIKVTDYVQILVLLVITGALVVSILVQRKKENLDESNIYLKSSIDLINKAYSVLRKSDGTITSSRVSWVTAARLITRAQSLAVNILLQSHKIIYESEHDFQRHRFHDLLKINGKSMPVEFFCGMGYLSGSIGRSAYGTLSKSQGVNWIPSRIVAVIYRFSTFPDQYEDPLNDSVKLTNRELERLWMFNERGACDYLTFREYFTYVSGGIYRVKGVKEAVKVNASEIDDQMVSLSGIVDD